MEITIDQCKHTKIEITKNGLYLDNNEYKTGEIIIGFIESKDVEGRLYILENKLYFLQNKKYGSAPESGDKLNFKYGWNFSVVGNLFTCDVKLFNYKKEKDFNIEELELKYPKPTFMLDNYSYLRQTTTNKNLFKLSPIPECCGATLLNNFRRDNTDFNPEYIYSDLEINEINQYLKNMTTNKIAYLLVSTESQAITFLTEKLNFKIIDEFRNSNTSNLIQLLSRNDIP